MDQLRKKKFTEFGLKYMDKYIHVTATHFSTLWTTGTHQ